SSATNASMWGYHRTEVEALGTWQESIERLAAAVPLPSVRSADAREGQAGRRAVVQRPFRLPRRERLHRAQPPLHRPPATPRVLHHVARLLQLLLDLVQDHAELPELRLHPAEHRPHLAGAALDGQG